MKVRLIQKPITDLEITKHLEAARSDAVGLVCFGELGGTGCLYQRRDVPSEEHWLDLSRTYPSLQIMIGAAVRRADGLHNSYLYLRNGQCQAYDKINLFPGMGEDKVYLPGTIPTIWETPFGLTGITICYDVRFPELYVELKRLGATTVLVPAAFPRVRIGDWNDLLVQRARESSIRIVGINSVGDDGTNLFGGSTAVIESDGTLRFRMNDTGSVTIDFDV
ncbi:MAG: nitrilase-related carbon-nitrogen hydrolase [Candidatus Zixiibacteriota bacterium]